MPKIEQGIHAYCSRAPSVVFHGLQKVLHAIEVAVAQFAQVKLVVYIVTVLVFSLGLSKICFLLFYDPMPRHLPINFFFNMPQLCLNFKYNYY